MRYIFSDVHGHDKNLKAFLKIFKNNLIYNLGDVTGYLGNSDNCYRLLMKNNVRSIKATHDLEGLVKLNNEFKLVDEQGNEMSLDYNLSEVVKDYIRSLPILLREIINQKKHLFIHGFAKKYKNSLIFDTLSEDNVESFLKKSRSDVVFVGHSHIPQYFKFKDGILLEHKVVDYNTMIQLDDSLNYIFDVGSLSDSRHPKLFNSYIKYDDENKEVQIIANPRCTDKFLNLEYNELPIGNWHQVSFKKENREEVFFSKKINGLNLYVGFFEVKNGYQVERVIFNSQGILYDYAKFIPDINLGAKYVIGWKNYLEKICFN